MPYFCILTKNSKLLSQPVIQAVELYITMQDAEYIPLYSDYRATCSINQP